jgi:myo-inositol-1(or 4)-monophosphatase
VNTAGLEKVLLLATKRAMAKVVDVADRGERNRGVGVGASGDKTTVADKEAEDVIVRALMKFGDLSVLSEEAGWVGRKDSRKIAIVDPLDGSSNFERAIPFYCSSVAVAEGRSLEDVSLALVRDLVSGDAYVARKGKGAVRGGTPLLTSRVNRLEEAVVGIDVSRGSVELVNALAPLISGAKRQVHFGANALELCYLADGKIDAFVDLRGRIRVTDVAAAYLIAREAGAVITDPRGRQLDPGFEPRKGFSLVASANEGLHKEILELCRPLAGD